MFASPEIEFCKYEQNGQIRISYVNLAVTFATPPATKEEAEALLKGETVDVPTCDMNYIAIVVPYLQAGNTIQPLYTDEELYQQEISTFKNERLTLRSTPIKVNTSKGIVVFDADTISRENLLFALQAWDKVILDDDLIQKGLVLNDGKSVQLGWITAENTLVYLTKADLQSAIEAFSIRYSRLVAGYLGSKFLTASKYGITLPDGLVPDPIKNDPNAGLDNV